MGYHTWSKLVFRWDRSSQKTDLDLRRPLLWASRLIRVAGEEASVVKDLLALSR